VVIDIASGRSHVPAPLQVPLTSRRTAIETFHEVAMLKPVLEKSK
jgi:hypothetical protein